MKKISLLLGLVMISMTSLMLFSFTTSEEDRVEVTVTSDKPSRFDLHMYKEGKILKGLVTPYMFTVDRNVAHYILKSAKPRSEIRMEVKRNGKTALTANWALIVLTRNNDELSTFGFTD